MTKRDFQKYLRGINAHYTSEFAGQTRIGLFIVCYEDTYFLIYTPSHPYIRSATICHDGDPAIAWRKLIRLHMRLHKSGLRVKGKLRTVSPCTSWLLNSCTT